MAMKTIVFVLMHLALCTSVLGAGGKIAGKVTARADGNSEPLVGATVFVQGTVRGTTTNASGDYTIADLPAGTYSVTFSMVGYQRETRAGVRVDDGETTVLNVSLLQTPIQTEQIVVTASKREQSLEEVPVSISVMDATEMRYRNSLTLEDAMRYVPGVNLTGGQINIRGSSGYSRGVGSRVLMLIDGVPFIAGDTGELIFESIPVGQVDRIEVVKGASSALYGSSALGGVVNVITKPITEIPETFVRTYGGLYNKPSFDKWKWSDKNRYFSGFSISHARRVGDLGIALFFSRQVDDGYRMNDYRRRSNFYMKMRQDFESENSLTVNFGMLNQYGGQFVYWRNLDSALIPPALQVNDNVKSYRYYINGIYNDALSSSVLFTAKAIWNRNDWGYETINAIGRTESLSDGLRAEAGATVLADERNTITFGLSGQLDIVNSDLFAARSGWGAAAFIQDEFKVTTDFTVTAGMRFDIQSLGLTESGPQFNPKLAFAYNPFSGTTLRASAGRGFRIPSVAEAFISAEVSGLATLPNADLKPERSFSYEIGLSQAIGDFATIDVAAFRSDYDNLIEPSLETDSTGNRLLAQWKNVTKARVQGVETSVKLALFGGDLQYNLGYTYVYPQDLTAKLLLKYRPRHILYTNFLAHIGVLRVGADFRYISRVDRVDELFSRTGLIPDGDERVEIIVTDFRLGADFSSFGVPVNATFSVNNAFRYNYLELIANVMPPRTFVLVLEAKL